LTVGYSGTPLVKKLGLKDGDAVGFAGLPGEVRHLLTDRAYRLIQDVETWDALEGPMDVVHVFTNDKSTVDKALPALANMIEQNGMIWMSWPKKASKVPTDVTEDVIRNTALRGKLVDVKVCAVNEVWSGLKLVIRKELRT
jgi:hypothetical protein